MHHYRISLSGSRDAVAAVTAELLRAGARRSGQGRLMLTTETAFDDWAELSRRHSRAVLGLECFQAFEDELCHLVVEDGRITEMNRGSVLSDDFGRLLDEDGLPLDEDLLRSAAESVDARRSGDSGASGLAAIEIAIAVGRELGAFCSRVETPDQEGDRLDAVIDLAVLALSVATAGADQRELDFEQTLTLTRSMVHASRSEFFEAPGEASWTEWLQFVIGAAADVIDAACNCWPDRDTHAHAMGAEYYGTPHEHLELAARSLLTTCIETLALFQPVVD